MKLLNITDAEKNQKVIEFSVDKATFDAAVDKVYKKNVAKLNIPGFRRGKAPKSMIEKMYGKGFFYEDAINEILPEAYASALEESGLDVVSHPEIDIKTIDDNGVVIIAKVFVKPEAKVGEYKGIRVVSGALDQIAGTIGCGVTSERLISEMTGTIMAICVMTDKMPPYNPDSIIPCHLHAIDGKYCLILWSSTAGMALKWFRNNFAESFSFRELDELAAKIPAGCEGLTMLPYFCGSTMPKYNPNATASFTGVTLSHTRAHFARAIMEAVAYTLKQNLS